MDILIAPFIFSVAHSVSELSQKEFFMSLKAVNTVNMTSMCCLRHAVGSVVSGVGDVCSDGTGM
jgi:hypothetical protein